MKKYSIQILAVMLCALLTISPSAFGQYQLANSGFEEWESVSGGGKTGEEPLYWSSFLEATGDMANMVQDVQLEKRDNADAHSGNYCAYIYARDVMFGISAQGNLTTGQINGGSTSAADATGNYNYTNESTGHAMRFVGRPDSMKVWLKGNTASNVKIAAYLHAQGYYQDPNTAGANVALIAEASAAPTKLETANGWQQYSVPFTYSSSANPYYALVSFATCNVAGGGNANDKMYIDDVEMVYVSELKSATYNGNTIPFDGTSASVDAKYSEKLLKVVSGKGANIEKDFNETTYVLTLTIQGGNYEEDNTNVHTYTIQFTGVASSNDDDPTVTIDPETTVTAQEWAAGTFYFKNVNTGTFLQNNNSMSTTPHAWTIAGAMPYTITDAEGNAVSLTRKSSKSSFAATNFNVTTNGSSATSFNIALNSDDNSYSFSTSIQYYDGVFSIGAKTDAIYFAANSNALTCQINGSTDNKANWILVDPQQYNRINGSNGFWRNYTTATYINPVDASDFIYDGQTVSNLPLGIYSIAAGSITVGSNTYTAASGKFYIPANTEVQFSGVSGLNYYGRLNLAVNGTYNGAAIADGRCNTIYVPGHDAEYLALTLGNGATGYTTSFDASTYTLTITVEGCERARETEVVFNAPDPALSATYMGEALTAGSTIEEEFDVNELSVELGTGMVNYTTSLNDETGVLTITLNDIYGNATNYSATFLPTTPATVPGSEMDFTTDIVYSFAGIDLSDAGTYAHVETLVNGNISFTLKNIVISDGEDQFPLGDITAQNIAISEDGRFSFSGNRRIGDDIMDLGKLPFVVSGQIKDGVLYGSASISFDESIKIAFSSHLTPISSQDYTDELVISVNGVANEPSNSTITVGTLGNGNINFLLKNFSLGDLAIGNISIDNLEISEDGNFNYTGSIFITEGDDPAVDTWNGPALGAIDLEMRGQIRNGQLAVVINIDLPGQLVHVTFGCQDITTTNYPEDLVITVNGISNAPQVANVAVSTIHNGNINFSLKNFSLGDLNVGNITIENLQQDAEGKLAYTGNISIAPGDDPSVDSWAGPALGLLPMDLVGQIKNGHIVAVINLNLPGQYVHVALGTTPVSTQDFTSDLVVSVNGVANAPQEATIEVGTLNNDNINFLLKNFSLGDLHVGNISIDNLALDAKGNFAYNDVIFIAPGDDPSVDSWAGPALGMIEIDLKGKMANDGLTVVINISIPEQDVHVTFGMTPESTRTFVRNVIVTIEGEDPVTQEDANIVVGQLKNGNINFILQDFYLGDMAVGSIAIENLEVAADSTFAFNDYMTISNGSTGEGWAGPAMGALLLNMTGKLDKRTNDTLNVHIDIDLTASLGYTVAVDLDNTKYTRTITNGNLGTICLPYAVAADAYTGATIYNIAGVSKANGVVTGIVLEEEIGDLVAGKPYIFKATADHLEARMNGPKTNTTADADGLVGNLSNNIMTVPEGAYIIMNDNLLHKVAVGNDKVTIATNRAYITLDSLDEATAAPRRIIVAIDGENSTTSLEYEETAKETVKVVENGHLYIKKNGQVYNALGQIVR